MGLGILGVIKRSIFYLPNYSLSFQLVIINLGIIISGLIFLTLFNYFLISTNKFFENRNKNILNNLNNISKYLENTSILRVPYFNMIIDVDILKILKPTKKIVIPKVILILLNYQNLN